MAGRRARLLRIRDAAEDPYLEVLIGRRLRWFDEEGVGPMPCDESISVSVLRAGGGCEVADRFGSFLVLYLKLLVGRIGLEPMTR